MRFFTVAIFVALLFFPVLLPAQSTSGIPGYIRIPSASLNPDGTFYIGTSFLPRKYLAYTNYKYHAATAFVSMTFLPFLEVDFRFTRQLGLPDYSSHVSDRMPSVRARLLKERKWWPSVTIGVHDFITSLESGSARHFESSYLVVTKGMDIGNTGLYAEGTVGYGTNWLVSRNYELLGLWGGISLSWQRTPWRLSLMADHDGNVVSVGAEVLLFRHLCMKTALVNGDSFTGCLSYRIYLK